MRSDPIVVAIAGGTGSGKTTLCQALINTLDPSLPVISQDNYYKDLSHLDADDRDRANFDHPEAVDTGLLAAHLAALKASQGIEVPRYDFVTHTRVGGRMPVEPAPVILIEGITLLVDPKVRALIDLSFYLDVAPDIRFIRRLQRDISERGRSADSVVRQYLDTVRPMHEAFVEPSRKYADHILTDNDVGAMAESVAAKIESHVHLPRPTANGPVHS